MLSFAGTHLLPTPSAYKPPRISHCRTPSLSSVSSTGISSTDSEAQTDAISEGTQDASIIISRRRESPSESEASDVEIGYEPKTPRPGMTPTTPTDRFTRLNVSSRHAKGESRFVHRRNVKSGAVRREAAKQGDAAGDPELPEVDVLLDGKNATRPATVSSPQPSTAKTNINRPTTSSTARFRPYTLRTRPSPHHPTPRLTSDSLPPSLRSQIQGEQPGKQWLLVGPEVARHLHMGGSVLVRDYKGNAVGWMS